MRQEFQVPQELMRARELYWRRQLSTDLSGVSNELLMKWASILTISEFSKYEDLLTGVPTFQAGKMLVGQELARARRYSSSLSVMMLDLDDFRDINAREGHLRGDTAIRVTAEHIKGTLRNADIVFRYGGDEFIICSPETGQAQAELVAKRLLEGLPARMSQDDFRVTASIGITWLRSDNQNVTSLLREADEALDDAKKSGKNTIATFSPER